MSGGEEFRLRERLERELGRPARARGLARGLALAVAVLLLIGLWMLRPATSPEPGSDGHSRGGIVVSSAGPSNLACSTSQYADKVRVVGSCVHRLDDLGVEIEIVEGAIFERAPYGVRMHEGRATFDVSSRPADDPMFVFVSHGRIEIMGTRFTVEQGARGGMVELLEGRIRFEHRDGSLADLMPGDSLRWGESVSVELGPVDAESDEVPSRAGHQRPRARDRAGETPSSGDAERDTGAADPDDWWTQSAPAENLLDELGGDESIEPMPYDRWPTEKVKNEELSYEQGLILDHQGDRERACHHWRRHLFSYAPGGVYAARAKRKELAACRRAQGEGPW